MYKPTLKQKRKALSLTMKQVAQAVGVSEATVSRWESGEIKDMKRDKILLLSKVLKISPVDLIFDMEYDSPFYQEDSFALKDTFSEEKIPLVGTIACGEPIWAEENIEEYISPPYGTDADYCLKCRGDSMINARIMDGDIVFVKRTEEVKNGQIAVVLIDNEATLKRFYRYDNAIVLNAENPSYKPIVIAGDALSSVRIQGVAVSFISSIL